MNRNTLIIYVCNPWEEEFPAEFNTLTNVIYVCVDVFNMTDSHTNIYYREMGYDINV